jgi:putative transcriptional regulator
MPIRVTLDEMITRRGLKAKDLAAQIGISETQLSLFRSGKIRGIRFGTLARMCAALKCKPAQLLDYEFDEADLLPPAADDDD